MPAYDETARRVAFWGAVACALTSIAYVLAQLLEWQGLLGSAGGPESASTPFGIALLLTPSLLLGSSFLTLAAALHRLAPPPAKVFSQIALAFATAYATLISMVYFVQLTLVAPRLAAGDTAGIEYLIFVPYRSFLFAVDLLGYSFMSVATLFAAFALPAVRGAGTSRVFLLLNGALTPFLAFQMFMPDLIWIAAFWGVTFPAAVISLALMFRKALPA
ncbi:MAG: hypothetical protein R3C46_12610 [Hyphomonadaceae bacterium]